MADSALCKELHDVEAAAVTVAPPAGWRVATAVLLTQTQQLSY